MKPPSPPWPLLGQRYVPSTKYDEPATVIEVGKARNGRYFVAIELMETIEEEGQELGALDIDEFRKHYMTDEMRTYRRRLQEYQAQQKREEILQRRVRKVIFYFIEHYDTEHLEDGQAILEAVQKLPEWPRLKNFIDSGKIN